MKSVTFVHGLVQIADSSSDDDNNYERRRELKYAFSCG